MFPAAKKQQASGSSEIAIIGMSGRFPKADDLNEYFTNLVNGIDCISAIPGDRWDADEYYDEDPGVQGKTYGRWMGFINDIKSFDPLFFDISPSEAEIMDPQQRLFMEEAWKALEDAGYTQKELENTRCGIFVGTGHGDYSNIVANAQVSNPSYTFESLSPSILPARISYFLNLKGPAVAVDTACSSSLVAIHEACGSINSGECEMCIAGGIRLMVTPELQIQAGNAGMLSRTGRCHVFDAKADGIVMGEGVGAVILKKLDAAIRDKDIIHGVIVSSGINQDGHTNGITAPSAESQSSLELEVYKKGHINPEDITFIEAHGTGTRLGDPIEIKGLKKSFASYTSRKGFCALGSVKANIGHTTMAAGVAGVMKILLSMKNGVIPPQIHFEKLNGQIVLDGSPFYISTKPVPWKPENGRPLMAAVSAFGFSGTNCHMVIRQP